MQTHNLQDALLRMNPLPNELKSETNLKAIMDFIDAKTSVSFHTHRQLLLNAGQVADHIYFVENGIARGYYYDDKRDKEHTACLWDAGSIVTEPNSFLKKIPSDLYIEVMPGSKLLSISRHQLFELYIAFPYAEAFNTCLTLQYISYNSKRIHDLIGLTAWKRYLELLQRHPKIEQKISKEIISSYLGITPQSLSRLIKINGHP